MAKHKERRDPFRYPRTARVNELCREILADELERLDDGTLCFYGDHVPGLPAVYRSAGYEDPRTDYLLWNARDKKAARADLPVERLGLRLLERAGLASATA